MKIKYILAGLAAASALILPSAVFGAALDSPAFDREAETVTVSGTAMAETMVTIEVLKPNYTWDEINGEDDIAAVLNKLEYVRQTKSDAEGRFSVTFQYTGDLSGVYPVRVYSYGDGQLLENNTDLVIYRRADIDTLIERIATAPQEELQALILDSNNAAMLGIDITAYLALTPEEQSDLINCFYSERSVAEHIQSTADIETILHRAALLREMNAASASAFRTLVDANLEQLGLDGTAFSFNIYNDAVLFDDTHKDMLFEELAQQDFATIAAFCETFGDRVLCLGCYRQNYHVIESVLEASEIFQALDSGRYSSLSDKTDVTKALNAMSTPCESAEALADKVRSLAASAGSGANNSPSGGSGGGRGPSGGGVPISVSNTPASEIDETEPLPEQTVRFSDMQDYAWAEEAVYTLRDAGIISGRTAETFCPSELITREEFIKLLVMLTGETDVHTEEAAEFEDVVPGEWYADYVKIGVQLGITNGISETAFGVGTPITRQDMAVMAARTLEYCGIPVGGTYAFADSAEIAEYARTAVEGLASDGIINGMGDGSFEPEANAERAQAAKIVYEIYRRVQEGQQ